MLISIKQNGYLFVWTAQTRTRFAGDVAHTWAEANAAAIAAIGRMVA